MTTDDMDTVTDRYARSNSTSFPATEKLSYYVEADGILNALIIKEQEDRGEEVWQRDMVADQSNYQAVSRIHDIKWLEIDYGDGFVPARYMSEASLIDRYGSEYESALANWPASDPIYNFKGSSLFVYPTPTSDQAGDNRLRASVERLPADLDRSSNTTPTLVPVNFHHLHCAYAAFSWLDEADPLWTKARRKWTEGVALMQATMFPRALQNEIVATAAADDGSDL
jgi:hypothetical protein